MDEARQPIHLLAADPGLGERLSAAQLSVARRSVLAPVERLAPGRWDVGRDVAPAAGFLVLEGCLTREVRILGQSSAIEFLAQGDVMRPSVEEAGLGSVDSSVVWEVLEPTRLALLDRHFLRAVSPWADVVVQLLTVRNGARSG